MEIKDKTIPLLNVAEAEVFAVSRKLGEKLYGDMVNQLSDAVNEIEIIHKTRIDRAIFEAALYRTNSVFTALLVFHINENSPKKPGLKVLYRLLRQETIRMLNHIKSQFESELGKH